MNEIDKLKIENTRYKKALRDIECGGYNTASRMANEALNPAPPVTLEQLVTALCNQNRSTGEIIRSIRFFSDKSGHLYGCSSEKYIASFYSFQSALDYLNGVT